MNNKTYSEVLQNNLPKLQNSNDNTTFVDKVEISNIQPYESNRDYFPPEYANELKLQCIDSKNEMRLFHYSECTDNDTDLVKNCRGNIYYQDKLIAKSFNYVPNYLQQEVIENGVLHSENWENYVFYPSYEGTLVRVFYFDNKWNFSTHKRIDAFKSKWSSKITYGETFRKCICNLGGYHPDEWEQFFNILDTSKLYCFLLLSTPDNRIVSTGKDYEMLHVGTFYGDNFELDLDDIINVNNDMVLNKPEKLHFTTQEEVYNYVQNQDVFKQQGIIVFNKKNNNQFKMTSDEYQRMCDIRGNVPSIKFRYLQLRQEPENVKELSLLYPEFVKWFTLYETILLEICTDILNAYYVRFIYNQYIKIPPYEYSIMMLCRDWLSKNNVTTMNCEIVKNIVNTQKAITLNKIIRERCFSSHKKDCYTNTINVYFYYFNSHTIPRDWYVL